MSKIVAFFADHRTLFAALLTTGAALAAGQITAVQALVAAVTAVSTGFHGTSK